ncbi:MAG TPA: choice-of-anchor D domain-containing protein [Verrucomicrobiales bacterium]|nr:choice-of-anchor D domain-containing protein [Verrucomicrobiales bacterium]
MRGGTSPEVEQVTFELSLNGTQWTTLGTGQRISGGWQRTALTLPPHGTIRARGRAACGSNNVSSSLFETLAVFDFPVPEIEIHADAAPGDGGINSGQSTPVDFGTTRQTVPASLPFTVSNAGTAVLIIADVAVPAGFSVADLPPAPLSIEPGASLTFRVVLDAALPGSFAGTVSISNNDEDESSFVFPVTGLVVTPEIAVHEGSREGPELADGQTAKVDFGKNVQGTPATRSFTLANTGSAELKVTSITVPSGYSALNVPTLPFTIGIAQSANVQISLTTTSVGTYSGSVLIASDDLDETVFDFPITGEVFIPEPVSSVATATTTLNRQTGLREQTIHITNDTTATVPAYNLVIRGLPAGVEVNNASETRPDGSFVIYIRQGMQPHSSQDIVIEYYSPDRNAVEVNPQLSTEVVLNPPDLTAAPEETGLAINVVKRLAGGEMLLEFASTPGKRYQVQYSADGQSWQNSLPQIKAASNRTQWIDRGLPRTDSPPAQAGSRMYRVRETAP